jgi:hypothetical protein
MKVLRDWMQHLASVQHFSLFSETGEGHISTAVLIGNPGKIFPELGDSVQNGLEAGIPKKNVRLTDHKGTERGPILAADP